LVHAQRIAELAASAQQLEGSNPAQAAMIWREALGLLPGDSPQAAAVAQRAGMLAAGFVPPVAQPAQPRRREARSDDLAAFLLKTGGSMALSIALFAWSYDWQFAVAFVSLIFIHEMGHVIANWYFGLKQSAPIFLGYFGAVIFLRENPPNAKVEGIIGIAGPVTGTLGALGCYYLYLQTGQRDLGAAAAWGFFINAWNLLPIPPLDGGRAAAALTPFLWVIGAAGLVFVELTFFVQSGTVSFIGLFILFWILRSTIPRLRETIFKGGWRNRYYQTTWLTKAIMSLTWLALLAVLVPELIRLHPWSATVSN
jgi:Zn-dependent protease